MHTIEVDAAVWSCTARAIDDGLGENTCHADHEIIALALEFIRTLSYLDAIHFEVVELQELLQLA